MKTQYRQLITAAQLQGLLQTHDNENLILLDASINEVMAAQPKPSAWPDVVIANSQRFDLKCSFSDTKSELSFTLPSAEKFQRQARMLGINNNSQVVIYDDIGLYSAPRAWWMFKAMGLANVAVLDGGLPEWLAQGRRTQSGRCNAPTFKGDFVVNQKMTLFCGKQTVSKAILANDQVIIDARAADRFSGKTEDPRSGVRNGHIPSAFNLPYVELQDHGKMLCKEQLKAKLNALNSAKYHTIFSCGSGITACVLALAADICGYEAISVYDGSWSDWGSDLSLPVALN